MQERRDPSGGDERVALSTRDFAIVTMDVEGLVTGWNPGAEALFGWSAAEMLGTSVDRVFTEADLAAGVPAEERRVAAATGRAEDERWHRRRDGTSVFCSGVTTTLAGAGTRGFVKIARDRTASKRREDRSSADLAQERLGRSEADTANRLKDQFLAVVSHELKNPLNLVQINAELLSRLAEVRASEVGSRAAQAILRAVAAQSRIIDDLLDLSRTHAGKLTLELGTFDLRDLIERIGAQLRSQVAIEHRVELRLPDDPVIVRGDAMRIEQVVWNLLSNALKFTPAGGSIALVLAREGDRARIDVRDDGRGIDPAFLPRMFTLFQQADRHTTRAHGGLGIGLALVRDLVGLHGGTVGARSDGVGRGATFSVFLPTWAPAADARATSATKPRLAGLRVLIVDDAPDTIEAFRMLLELEGANVLDATDGRHALALLDTHELDVLCSDIAMPGMDGYALIQAVRARPGYERLPAIALTGFGRAADAERAREAGFDAHLVKPFRLDQLFAVFGRLGVCE